MTRIPSLRIEPDHQRETYYRELLTANVRRYRSLDPVAVQAFFNLIQTFACGEAQMSSLVQEKGLTLPGMNVLAILRDQGEKGCPLNRLSDLLLVSRANITGVFDSLVRKGLAVRVQHATDRRVTLARITKVGEKWLEAYLPGHYARLREMFSGLNGAECRTLSRLLEKLRHSSCFHPRANA